MPSPRPAPSGSNVRSRKRSWRPRRSARRAHRVRGCILNVSVRAAGGTDLLENSGAVMCMDPASTARHRCARGAAQSHPLQRLPHRLHRAASIAGTTSVSAYRPLQPFPISPTPAHAPTAFRRACPRSRAHAEFAHLPVHVVDEHSVSKTEGILLRWAPSVSSGHSTAVTMSQRPTVSRHLALHRDAALRRRPPA